MRKILLFNTLKLNKITLYLISVFASIIIFAFLYYINDYFITNNIELAKKLYFIPNNYKKTEDKTNDFVYYLWFSLITQSTIGYGGLINENTGQNVPFSRIYYRPFKILNILQIISVFLINIILII
jgi:hypothetical protein